MEIRVDGSRSSSENWMRAETAPLQELPELSAEQRAAAASLGVRDEDDLLESGSRIAEESIARIVDYSLPASWVARPS
jgi:hypothetical protein